MKTTWSVEIVRLSDGVLVRSIPAMDESHADRIQRELVLDRTEYTMYVREVSSRRNRSFTS